MTCCKWFGQLWRQNYQPLRRPGSFLHRRRFAGIISVPSQETLFTFFTIESKWFYKKMSRSMCLWCPPVAPGLWRPFWDSCRVILMTYHFSVWLDSFEQYSILFCSVTSFSWFSSRSCLISRRVDFLVFFFSFVVYSSARLLWLYSTQNQVVKLFVFVSFPSLDLSFFTHFRAGL